MTRTPQPLHAQSCVEGMDVVITTRSFLCATQLIPPLGNGRAYYIHSAFNPTNHLIMLPCVVEMNEMLNLDKSFRALETNGPMGQVTCRRTDGR